MFGLLGAGNVGNDGSLEAVLAYLRAEHPDAVVESLCSGPDVVAGRYGIPAVPLYWYYSRSRQGTGITAVALKVAGKFLDTARVLRWVRRFDVVIVPGTGVLENTLPVRPWGFPYSLFLLCVAGRLTGTRIALVNVGSNVIRQRSIRTLYRTAANLAHYRSFRDTFSRDAMRTMGVDTSGDQVYPDLVFGLPEPAPAGRAAVPGTVGVGVMAFHGSTDDRRQGEEIYHSYLDAMKRFVRWLVANDRRIMLFTGDRLDDPVVSEILADVHTRFPHSDRSTVVAEPVSTLGELMARMASVDVVVGTRYHNVVCALKLAKPTISISYSAKSDHIMAEMGLGEFCQPARAVDVDRLIRQFTALEQRAPQIRGDLVKESAAKVARLEHQYAVLSASLFDSVRRSPLSTVRTEARRDS